MSTKNLILIFTVLFNFSTYAKSIVLDINGQSHKCTPISSDGGGASDCYDTAYSSIFSSSESRMICAGAISDGPAKCAIEAYRGIHSKQESINLCIGAIDVSPVTCFKTAYASIYSSDESRQLCTGAYSVGPAECAKAAYSGPFSKEQTLELCSAKQASVSTAKCALEAYSGPHTKEESIELCRPHNGHRRHSPRGRNKSMMADPNTISLEEVIKLTNLKAFQLNEYK